MNKTTDIEFSIMDHLTDGPATLDQVMRWLDWVGDPRWIAVALLHLRQAGKIRHTTCDSEHSHDGACVIEAVAR